jgi:hypothetical protein
MKKTALLPTLFLFLNAAILGVFLFRYCAGSAPLIGHDYRLFLPNMADNALFQQKNGLAIHWYTPRFAGGLPVYANPQDIQYSLPQLLTWFVNPWRAVRIAMVVYLVAGFLGDRKSVV